MNGIEIIRTLQADYGLGDDTVLALLAQYIDAHCDPESVFEFLLDRADPEPEPETETEED